MRGYAAEFLRQSGGGICTEPEDEDSLLQAIEQFRSDPSLAQELGKKGQQYVLRHYDRDLLARDYLELVERTVQSKGKVAHHVRVQPRNGVAA